MTTNAHSINGAVLHVGEVSLTPRNGFEAIHLGQLTDKMDRWHKSGQEQRWVANTLLLIEPDCEGSQASALCRCFRLPCSRRSGEARLRRASWVHGNCLTASSECQLNAILTLSTERAQNYERRWQPFNELKMVVG